MTMIRLIPALALSVSLLAPTVASASFPAGVWGLVEKVTLEPDADNPLLIRIDGVFMVANQKPDFPQYPGYSVPQYGHMYYACNEADLKTCVMEWTELAAVPGTENLCRGWGDSSLPDNGTVRTVEPAEKPDIYPISMGILQGMTPCEALKNWTAENPNEGTTGETGGETSGSTSGETSGETSKTTGETSKTTGETGEGSTGNATSESGGSGESGSGSSASAGETSAATGDNPTSDGNETANVGSSSTAEGGGSSSSGGAETGQTQDDDKGCACRSDGEDRPLAALAAVIGLLALRRRRA